MTRRITKIVNILILAALVVIVLFTNLTESQCYTDLPSGRVVLDTQNLTGWDFITEENPPKPIDVDGSHYSFEEYRMYTIMIVGLFVFLICLQALKISLISMIVFNGCFAVAFWAGLQFTQYPNYYFELCVQKAQGMGISTTIDSNTPIFGKLLLISMGLVSFNWAVYFKNRKSNRKPNNRLSNELLDS
ncbi:MAG: hypothetical protein V4604_12540 [Bacteroidota bacterium]